MLTCDHYLMPASLDEVFALMDEHRGGRYRLVAGCTDVVPWARPARADDVHYPALIDLTRVSELNGVELRGGRVHLGANTAFQAFLEDAFLRRQLPVMRHCAAWFADDQIRRQATLGGNLVNASPAADGAPPMLAMDSAVVLISRKNGARQQRTLPLTEFILGPGETRLEEGEVLMAIECDSMHGYGGAFKKVGHRRSLVISVACAAILVKVDETRRRFADARVALGGIGPVPVRAVEIEQHLQGKPITLEAIEAAADLSSGHVQSRTRQDYRREVTRNFVVEAIVEALGDAGVNVDGSGGEPARMSPALGGMGREPAGIRGDR
jgi:xanthine dehydrogenase FAD-binding subunit